MTPKAPSRTRMPAGLGDAGKGLWRCLSDVYVEFTPSEVQLLTMACRTADDCAKLEAAIRKLGAFVTGSAGQPVLNPAIPEARQSRLAISRLLGLLDLPNPDDEEKPATAASRHAAKAANSRWLRVAKDREGARGEA